MDVRGDIGKRARRASRFANMSLFSSSREREASAAASSSDRRHSTHKTGTHVVSMTRKD